MRISEIIRDSILLIISLAFAGLLLGGGLALNLGPDLTTLIVTALIYTFAKGFIARSRGKFLSRFMASLGEAAIILFIAGLIDAFVKAAVISIPLATAIFKWIATRV